MEKADGAIWREKFCSLKLEKTGSVHLQVACLKESLSVIMIEQEQFCALPRTELCEGRVGQDRHWWQMVAPELKLTQRVTADKEGAGPPLPRIAVERTPEAEPR